MTATETLNGAEPRQKGRTAPPEKLEDFTFQGTGRMVQVRKISTLIRDEVRRQVRRDPNFAEPEPPQQDVDYGDGKVRMANRAHPIYQELMKDWREKFNREVGDRLVNLVIQRGVVCEVDEAAVERVRAELAEQGISTSHLDNHYVFVAFVCIGPYEDYTDLLKAVFERSTPVEAAVQAHLDSFPGDVRRAGSVELEPRPASGPEDAPV